MKITRTIATGVGLMVLACATHAMSIRELHALEKSDKRHGPEYVQYYLIGALEGAMETSAQSARAGSKALICLNGRRLEPRIARSLFDAELKRHADLYEADMPVELVMVNALTTVYMC
jgi:hypothetical protein